MAIRFVSTTAYIVIALLHRKPTEMDAVDVYHCLIGEDKFDFLTNKHMGVTLVDDDLPNTSDCDS